MSMEEERSKRGRRRSAPRTTSFLSPGAEADIEPDDRLRLRVWRPSRMPHPNRGGRPKEKTPSHVNRSLPSDSTDGLPGLVGADLAALRR